MPSFSWERGPFERCPGCQQETLGILSAGGDCVTLRCTNCRYSHSEVLPEVEKRVIYLDQSAFSALFNAEREPALSFDVDEVLESARNVWLPDMHVHVNTNFEMFADSIREHRARAHEGMQRLVERWAVERPTFDHLLDLELRAFFARPQALAAAVLSVERAAGTDDPMALLEAASHPILKEHEMLTALFLRTGMPEADVAREVYRFWHWKRNMELPHHRIAAYLYAAIGNRVANGQRRVNRGMMNDVRAISTYAPYVDAMFVDRECAALLTEPRLAADLQYKARIFSFANPDAFLGYLDELEASTSDVVRAQATRIYGIHQDNAPLSCRTIGDPIRLKNYVRLIMTSNEDWVVPAGKDERRFCVLDIDPRCAQNSGYFAEMDRELNSGGREAQLRDLLDFDLSAIDLRKIPKTQALLEQKIRSLDSAESWWLDRLNSGVTEQGGSTWQDEVPTYTLFKDYIAHSKEIGVRRKLTQTSFGCKLHKLVPNLRKRKRSKKIIAKNGAEISRRVICYLLPSLEKCRDYFQGLFGQEFEWLEIEPISAESAPDESEDPQ